MASAAVDRCYIPTSKAKNGGQDYQIGDRCFFPLINAKEVNSHLKLLTAFKQLKYFASTLPGYTDVAPPSYGVHGPPMTSGSVSESCNESSLQWSIYLTKALFRFELYINHMLTPANTGATPSQQIMRLNIPPLLSSQDERKYRTDPVLLKPSLLPPLDVLMIWHTYLLNPSRYNEDLFYMPSRMNLAGIQFPLCEVASRLEPMDPYYNAPEAAQEWENVTGEPFDLLTPGRATCPMPCHNCNQPKAMPWEDIVQPTWSFKCEKCAAVTSQYKTMGRRWLDAVQMWARGDSQTHSFRLPGAGISSVTGCFFISDPYSPVLVRLFDSNRKGSGIMLGPSGELKMTRFADNYGEIESAHIRPNDIYEAAGHDIHEISKLVLATTQKTINSVNTSMESLASLNLLRRVSLMMSFYLEANAVSPASIDLVAAVQRQFRFIGSIDKLGWLNPKVELDHTTSIARYHAWLNIAAKHLKMLCPTLDIDLAWHTHQLKQSYYCDCFATVLRFVDHNDKVDKSYLRDAFDDTISLWTAEYKQPYSIALRNGEKSTFKSPKRLFNKLKTKAKSKSAQPLNDNTDTQSHQTNPSIHNAVIRHGAEEQHEDEFE